MASDQMGALEKALHLLGLFGQSSGSVQTLSELTRASGLSRATCHRALRTLQEYGLLDREGDGYRLGYRFLELAGYVKDTIEPLQAGRDIMDRLRDEVDQSVQLVVLNGDEGVYVEVMGSFSPTRLYIRPGRRAPLYCGASTRLLLSTLEDSRIDAILRGVPFVALTNRTPRTPEEVWEMVRTTRDSWVALSLGEMEPYSAELAVPILGSRGLPVAALSVAGRHDRYLTSEGLRDLLVALDAAALSISRRLGFDESWPVRPDVFLATLEEPRHADLGH